MKSVYISQPYAIGSKTGRSLALVIPHEVVLHYRLSPSTIIILRTEIPKKKIILEAFENEETHEKGKMMQSILDNPKAVESRDTNNDF
jgi:hypothetical protein